MRLGVLGGTFDPVHEGHLALARAARNELSLDEVLFVPAGQPWRKVARPITANADRLAMLERAIEGVEGFRVSTMELEREGPSYTADTLEVLRGWYPGDELFFLVGEDALADMPNWVRPERILELAKVAVARRECIERDALLELKRRLPRLSDRTVWLEMPLKPISATEIRERVRRGEPIGEMVPGAVERYIEERGLYRE